MNKIKLTDLSKQLNDYEMKSLTGGVSCKGDKEKCKGKPSGAVTSAETALVKNNPRESSACSAMQ